MEQEKKTSSKEGVKIKTNLMKEKEGREIKNQEGNVLLKNNPGSLFSKVEKIFQSEASFHQRILEIVNMIKMIPYLIFSGILFFAGISLIPQNKIMSYSKIFLPLFLSIIISIMLLLSGVFISIPTIDEILFDKGFSPIIGIIPGIFIGIVMFGILMSGGKVLKAFTGNKNKIKGLKTKDAIGHVIKIFGTALGLITLIVVFGAWGQGFNGFQNVWFFFNSFLGYLIYFGYIYLTINLVFLLYKKVIYLVFSLANREMSRVQKHIVDIVIYLAVILFVNSFLNIKIIVF